MLPPVCGGPVVSVEFMSSLESLFSYSSLALPDIRSLAKHPESEVSERITHPRLQVVNCEENEHCQQPLVDSPTGFGGPRLADPALTRRA